MQTKVVGIDSNAMIDIFRIDIRFFGSQEAAELETSQIEVFWQNKVVFMDRHFESMASQFSSNFGEPFFIKSSMSLETSSPRIFWTFSNVVVLGSPTASVLSNLIDLLNRL